MSQYLTDKQYKFAQYIFEGMTQVEAWAAAGYSTKYPVPNQAVNACMLVNSTKIKRRLDELHDKANRPGIMTVSERKKRLSELARANLVDFIDEKGQPQLNKNIEGHAAASQFYHRTKINRYGEETITKSIKLNSPVDAISELNRMEGIGRHEEPISQTNVVNIIVGSDRAKDLLERVSERTVINGSTVKKELTPGAESDST